MSHPDKYRCNDCGDDHLLHGYYAMPELPLWETERHKYLCEKCVKNHPCWCKKHKLRHLVFERERVHYCLDCIRDEVKERGLPYFARVLECAEREFSERAFRRLMTEVQGVERFARIVVEYAHRNKTTTGKVIREVLREKSIEVLIPNVQLTL